MKRRRGYLLIEVLCMLALFSIAAAMAARVSYSMWAIWARAQRSDQTLRKLDWISAPLRADVWSAADIRVDPTGTLILHDGADREVRWAVINGTVLCRQAPDGNTRWPDVAPNISFRATQCGVGLELHGLTDRTEIGAGGVVRRFFTSQLLIASANGGGR